MGLSRVRVRGRVRKRVRQVAYLVMHAPSHARCALALRRASLTSSWLASSKYLGDCFALSLTTAQRRDAMVRHHSIMSETFTREALAKVARGVTIWQREVP